MASISLAARGKSRNGRSHSSLNGAVNALGEDVSGFGKDVAALASAFGDEVIARAGAITEQAENRAQAYFAKGRAHVMAHPGASLGAAAGVGLLVGLLLAARR